MKNNPLNAAEVAAAKPRLKNWRLYDGHGLYLEIRPGGGRYWFYRFRIGTKDKRISLGVYPEVTLKDARQRRAVQRKIVSDGGDPSRVRRLARDAQRLADHTFQHVAKEYLESLKEDCTASHIEKLQRRLQMYVFPFIGSSNVENLETQDFLAPLYRIKKAGSLETARRTQNICARVMRHAIVTGRAKFNPAAGLSEALGKRTVKGHAFIKGDAQLAQLMRSIRAYQGSEVVRHALQLGPLLFVRPGELRNAEWSEIDFENSLWTIPAAKMKMGRVHVVPLALQSIAILESLKPITGQGRYVFPSIRSDKRPMSDGTINAALRTLGYGHDTLVGHGFRKIASTTLNELRFMGDAIELQLAHWESSVRKTYNHAEHLEYRKEMMQAWANHLFALADGASVTPIRAAA